MTKRKNLPAENSQKTSLPTDVNDLAEAIVPVLIEKMKNDRGEKTLSVSSSSTFSGPLPPSDEFERYNQVIPNAADRILKMAEREQQIRENYQKSAIRNDSKRINGAVLLGLSLIVVSGLATPLSRCR